MNREEILKELNKQMKMIETYNGKIDHTNVKPVPFVNYNEHKHHGQKATFILTDDIERVDENDFKDDEYCISLSEFIEEIYKDIE